MGWAGRPINLGLFKVIFYFPNGKSTIWGIYSEYFLFFGHPLSKSKIKLGELQGHSADQWKDSHEAKLFSVYECNLPRMEHGGNVLPKKRIEPVS